MRIAFGAGVLLSLVLNLAGPALAGQGRDRASAATLDSAQRAADRAQRAAIAKEYLAAKKSAENTCLSAFDGIARWLVTLNAKSDAQQIVSEIRAADPKFVGLAQLEKLIDTIAQPAVLDASKQRELASRRHNAQRQKAAALLDLASRCFRAELLGYAYDVAWEALSADPDNAVARQAMAQTKVGAKWYTPFEAAQLAAGKVYVPDAGWVAKAEEARVAAGEWQENGKWMSIAEANTMHARLDNPWTIETDNFILKSTASRKQAVFIAERLEAIRELCFREYLEFFLRGSRKSGEQMLFNKPFPKKLVVNYAGNRHDYEQTIAAAAIPADSKALLLRSAGFYSPYVHASFFFHDPNYGPFQIVVMQHEVTHQILGEYSGGSALAPWLAEGVADVLEAATPNGEGRLVLPHGYDHPDVIRAAELARRHALPDLARLIAFNRDGFHQEPGRRINYEVSGALCRFLLEYKDGAYASDFLEFLYDSYLQRSGITLEKFIGMDVATLDTEFRAYLAGCDESYSSPELAARSTPKNAEQRTPARTPAASPPPAKQPEPPQGNPFERGSSGSSDDNPFKRRED